MVNIPGLNEEGLFRKPGNNTEIQELKKQMLSGAKVDMNKLKNIHTLASLLKLYFRDLPDPLLTYDCFDMFCSVHAMPDVNVATEDTKVASTAKLEALKNVISYLPGTNRYLLRYLSEFLHQVSKSPETKMVKTNTCIITILDGGWAQCLFWSNLASRQSKKAKK